MAFDRIYQSVSDRLVSKYGTSIELEAAVAPVHPDSLVDPGDVVLPPAPRPLAEVLQEADRQGLRFDLLVYVDALRDSRGTSNVVSLEGARRRRRRRRSRTLARLRHSAAIPPVVA